MHDVAGRASDTAEHRTRLHRLLAACSVGCAIAHVLAAERHTQHPVVIAAFLVMAIAQVGWACYISVAPRRGVLAAGVAGNASIAVLWLFSRTTGVPIHPGLGVREPVGLLDVTATMLEIVIVAGCLFLLAPGPQLRRRPYPMDLAAASLAMGVVILALPGVLGTPIGGPPPVHEHGTSVDAIAHVHGGAGLVAHVGSPGAHDHASTGVNGGHTGHSPAAHADHAGHVAAHVHPVTPPTPAADAPAPRGVLATIRYGPFALGPAQVDQSSHVNPAVANIIRTKLATPCSNCYITAMEPDLVYADGSRANFDTGVMLHHAVLGDNAQADLTCGRGSSIAWMGRRFFAAGNERTKAVLPAPFGYRVGASDWWTGVFEIMNFKTVAQNVWFEFRVHSLSTSDPKTSPVVPVWLDENNCGNSQYSIPAGQSTKVWDWTSSITGRVVFAAGHVHDWGRKIALSNASTKQPMCKSVAGYGHDPAYQGNIESMTVCPWDRIGTVRIGERLEIAATYDAPEAHSDVMGIVLAYVYETSNLRGGTPAPSSMTDPPDGSNQAHPTHNH